MVRRQTPTLVTMCHRSLETSENADIRASDKVRHMVTSVQDGEALVLSVNVCKQMSSNECLP